MRSKKYGFASFTSIFFISHILHISEFHLHICHLIAGSLSYLFVFSREIFMNLLSATNSWLMSSILSKSIIGFHFPYISSYGSKSIDFGEYVNIKPLLSQKSHPQFCIHKCFKCHLKSFISVLIALHL